MYVPVDWRAASGSHGGDDLGAIRTPLVGAHGSRSSSIAPCGTFHWTVCTVTTAARDVLARTS